MVNLMLHKMYGTIAIIMGLSLIFAPLVILLIRSYRENFDRKAKEEEDRFDCKVLREDGMSEFNIKKLQELEGRTYYPPGDE